MTATDPITRVVQILDVLYTVRKAPPQVVAMAGNHLLSTWYLRSIEYLDRQFDTYFSVMESRGASQNCAILFSYILDNYKYFLLARKYFHLAAAATRNMRRNPHLAGALKREIKRYVDKGLKFLKEFVKNQKKGVRDAFKECILKAPRKSGLYLTGTQRLFYIPALFASHKIGHKMLEVSEAAADIVFEKYLGRVRGKDLEKILENMVEYYSSVISLIAYAKVVALHNNWYNFSSYFFDEIDNYIMWTKRLKNSLAKVGALKKAVIPIRKADNILKSFLLKHIQSIKSNLQSHQPSLVKDILQFCGQSPTSSIVASYTTYTFR
jgi:hypothetical protein